MPKSSLESSVKSSLKKFQKALTSPKFRKTLTYVALGLAVASGIALFFGATGGSGIFLFLCLASIACILSVIGLNQKQFGSLVQAESFFLLTPKQQVYAGNLMMLGSIIAISVTPSLLSLMPLAVFFVGLYLTNRNLKPNQTAFSAGSVEGLLSDTDHTDTDHTYRWPNPSDQTATMHRRRNDNHQDTKPTHNQGSHRGTTPVDVYSFPFK